MKRIILALIVLLSCVGINAQNLVATLIHNGNISHYYGKSGLQDAYNASVSGDIINLSTGAFDGGFQIKKNITLRGSGWKGTQNTNNTIINNIISIQIPSTDTLARLSFEGIYFTNTIYIDSVLHNPLFNRCRINQIQFYNIFNGIISNCLISNVGDNLWSRVYRATFMNCVVNVSCSNMSFVNCVLGHDLGNRENTYFNCIMVSTMNLHNTNTAQNCVLVLEGSSVNDGNNFYSESFGTNDTIVSSLSDVFVTPPTVSSCYFTITDTTSFELTPAAQAQLLGNDGTQVGIYGGSQPFTETTSYPRITKIQVAGQSDTQGKLNVDIEVTPAQ